MFLLLFNFSKTLWSAQAHEGFVRGICSDSNGDISVSCGTDKTIKFWKIHPNLNDDDDEDNFNNNNNNNNNNKKIKVKTKKKRKKNKRKKN